ncbi:non-specific lipid transfer protein GPI-anchored 5 [Nicotiana tabacum]|uniref:Non-specific lipid transfer protein GPI-anchored 5 n=1 Tax=Nicotiana tabacum TaxID=4097 RepID=A0A1S4CSS7_TOBAC|nr:non-specific lipid-transfer protein-like protein At5g64080 [Nicotiana tomentosiformis]XP_016504074.1 PREDICTED: non-specific lipid-transfer protein-like protein At5g64080 [Nicotiana tabacum]
MQISASTISAIIVVAVALLSLHVISAQSDCEQVVVGLAPCLQYIEGNATSPSSGCCTQLATIVKTQPQCLCHVLNGEGSSFGVNINQTLALALPTACNAHTPFLTLCKATSPTGSPEISPSIPSGDRYSRFSPNGDSLKLQPYSLLFTLNVATLSYVTIFSSIL